MNAYTLIGALIFTYILNIPFGYWREDAKRQHNKVEWIAAIHIPVPFVFIIRTLLGGSLTQIPFFILAFFLGQLTGGVVKRYMANTLSETSKCLIYDVGVLLMKKQSIARNQFDSKE